MDQELLDKAVLGHMLLQLVTRNAINSLTSRFNLMDNAFVEMHTAQCLNMKKDPIANAAMLMGKAEFSEIEFSGLVVRIVSLFLSKN